MWIKICFTCGSHALRPDPIGALLKQQDPFDERQSKQEALQSSLGKCLVVQGKIGNESSNIISEVSITQQIRVRCGGTLKRQKHT